MPMRAVLAILAVAHAAAAQPPAFVPIGDLPGGVYESQALGISPDGTVVVGRSTSASGAQAVVWTGSGGLTALPSLGAGFSEARAATTGGGVIVGASGNQACRWSLGASVQALGGVGGGRAFALTTDGSVIAGRGGSPNGLEAFRWTASGPQWLGDLPGHAFESSANGVSADGTVVVGYGRSTQGREAIRWTQATGLVGLGDLPGGFFESFAEGISADGHVIVGQSNSGAGWQAFRWTAANGMQGMGDLPGGVPSSHAFAASHDGGTIVGYAYSALGREAFVWTTSAGMRSVREVLLSAGVTAHLNWQLEDAIAVSANGRIVVGHGLNPSGNREGYIAFLPRAAAAGSSSQQIAPIDIRRP
jgi:probable HAF family extracellular repeat protein